MQHRNDAYLDYRGDFRQDYLCLIHYNIFVKISDVLPSTFCKHCSVKFSDCILKFTTTKILFETQLENDVFRRNLEG